MDPTPVFAENDDLRIAALDWGSDGPPLLLKHPNGFCAGIFDPLARQLRADYRPIGVDVRGHGASERPASLDDCTFTNGVRDVLAVLDALGIDELVALGHSFGGGLAVLLDAVRPGVVRKALLCEAIVFPLSGQVPGVPSPAGPGGPNPMAALARKRRAVWPDRATVLESYASRPPMDVMERDVLAAYVRWGFRDRPDGRIELSCEPEVEARFFEAAGDASGAALAFAHLPTMKVPLTVVCGTATNLPNGVFAAQAEAAGTPLLQVEGTHFFPQEDTTRTAGLVREHLSW